MEIDRAQRFDLLWVDFRQKNSTDVFKNIHDDGSR